MGVFDWTGYGSLRDGRRTASVIRAVADGRTPIADHHIAEQREEPFRLVSLKDLHLGCKERLLFFFDRSRPALDRVTQSFDLHRLGDEVVHTRC